MNNLLVGARNIDHRGQFHVLNLATNDAFQCSIKEPFFGKSRHEVRCHCACAQAAALRMHVYWPSYVSLCDVYECISSALQYTRGKLRCESCCRW